MCSMTGGFRRLGPSAQVPGSLLPTPSAAASSCCSALPVARVLSLHSGSLPHPPRKNWLATLPAHLPQPGPRSGPSTRRAAPLPAACCPSWKLWAGPMARGEHARVLELALRHQLARSLHTGANRRRTASAAAPQCSWFAPSRALLPLAPPLQAAGCAGAGQWGCPPRGEARLPGAPLATACPPRVGGGALHWLRVLHCPCGHPPAAAPCCQPARPDACRPLPPAEQRPLCGRDL